MATIGLEIYLLLLCCSLNFAIGGVCPASTPTVKIVPKCPTTKAEMEEAARRKNCDMIKDSKQCDMPPVYHCLLNQWRNATVEVCTSPWFISGFCAIYNTDEMKVSDDFQKDCTNFTSEKCPTRYHSPEAYMYQKCYEMEKNPSVSNVLVNSSGQESRNTDLKIVIGMLSFIVFILFVALFQGRLRAKLKKKDCRYWLCLRKSTDIETRRDLDDEEKLLCSHCRHWLCLRKSTDIETPRDLDDEKNPLCSPSKEGEVGTRREKLIKKSNLSRQENLTEDSGREGANSMSPGIENRRESNLPPSQSTPEKEQRFNSEDNNGTNVDNTPLSSVQATKAKFEDHPKGKPPQRITEGDSVNGKKYTLPESDNVSGANIDGGSQTSRDDSKRQTNQQNAEGVEEQTSVNGTVCDTKENEENRYNESESSNTEENDNIGSNESDTSDTDENVIKVDSGKENSDEGCVRKSN